MLPSHLRLALPQCLFPFNFPIKLVVKFLALTNLAKTAASLILLYMITLQIFVQNC